MSDPKQLAADPSTTPEVLAQLAYQHPELHPLIAQHPNAYPELVAWIVEYGSPRPAKKSRVPWIVGGVAVLVAAVIGVVFLFTQRGGGEEQDPFNHALLELEAAIEAGEVSLEKSQTAQNELISRLEVITEVSDADEAKTVEYAWDLFAASVDAEARLSKALEEGHAMADAARETSDKTGEIVEDVRLATENLALTTTEADELSADTEEVIESLDESQLGGPDDQASASSTECKPPVPGAYPCAGGPIPDEARPITSVDSEWATLRFGFPGDEWDRGCYVRTYEGEQQAVCSTETLFESIWPEKCVGGGEWCSSNVTLGLGESGPAEPGAPFSEAPPYFGEYGPPKGEMIVPGDVVYHDDFVFALSPDGMTVWNARSGYGAFAGFDGSFVPCAR